MERLVQLGIGLEDFLGQFGIEEAKGTEEGSGKAHKGCQGG